MVLRYIISPTYSGGTFQEAIRRNWHKLLEELLENAYKASQLPADKFWIRTRSVWHQSVTIRRSSLWSIVHTFLKYWCFENLTTFCFIALSTTCTKKAQMHQQVVNYSFICRPVRRSSRFLLKPRFTMCSKWEEHKVSEKCTITLAGNYSLRHDITKYPGYLINPLHSLLTCLRSAIKNIARAHSRSTRKNH